MYFIAQEENIIIQFHDDAILQFKKYQQLQPKAPEAGGQLFAQNNSSNEILICEATEPKKKDKRNRFLFLPNRQLEQKEIYSKHKQNLHFIGDWHTHPEPIAKPSEQDLISMRKCFIESKHQCKYFLMVIIGTATFPKNMSVSLHNDIQNISLKYYIPYTSYNLVV